MKLTVQEIELVKRLTQALAALVEGGEMSITRAAAAAMVGRVDDRAFRLRTWWPAVEVLQAGGITLRSAGGGGRYLVADWKGKVKHAARTYAAAKRRFARAARRLPAPGEVPEEAQPMLARARDRYGAADWAALLTERASQTAVASVDPRHLLQAKTDLPRRAREGAE